MSEQLKKIRAFELECIKPWIFKGAKILEIGGGNGFQASIISSWGCDVVSIDIPERPLETLYFPVIDYDGFNIPFENSVFDIVFSSNVLEHVKDPVAMSMEIKRVINNEGKVIHILPSSSWRFWTSLTHYANLFRLVLLKLWEKLIGIEIVDRRESSIIVREHSIKDLLSKALIPPVHGEYPNSIAELFYYRRHRWLELFESSGFETITVYGNGLFYTGHLLFPKINFRFRKLMARVLGSSCNIFIMKVSERENNCD